MKDSDDAQAHLSAVKRLVEQERAAERDRCVNMVANFPEYDAFSNGFEGLIHRDDLVAALARKK